LPDRPADNEIVVSWNVREPLLSVGRDSALAVGAWEECLDLNAEIAASKKERDAGLHELMGTRFNEAWPLIRLGRLAEAERLLAECRQVFEDSGDITRLAAVLGTRADLEDELGHQQAAADLQRTALRYFYANPEPRDSYAMPEPRDIAVGHNNLADYLRRLGSDAAAQRAHRLAAALVFGLADMNQNFIKTVGALAAELREDGNGTSPPWTIAQVIRTAELTEGVRLAELLAALKPDRQAVADALAYILSVAATLAA
jgi:tetratricopeptide (TPR) repeat protein